MLQIKMHVESEKAILPGVRQKAAGRGRINYDYDEKGEDVGGGAVRGGGGFRRPRRGEARRRLQPSWTNALFFLFFFVFVRLLFSSPPKKTMELQGLQPHHFL